jgi:sulfur carrier protein
MGLVRQASSLSPTKSAIIDRLKAYPTMADSKISIRFNGEALEVPMGMTVAELLERAAIRTKLVAVEVNLKIVAHEEHAAHQVQAGDTIEVVTLVGGG